MFKFFKKNQKQSVLPFLVDVHSHLLPGLDDGVKSADEALHILNTFVRLGYKKIITTPHVMSHQYPNTTEGILSGLKEMQNLIEKERLHIILEAAAEYYLDDSFMAMLDDNVPILTFGQKYLLFETSFLNKPAFFEEAVFKMNITGYKPVLAHPERYIYLQNDNALISRLKGMNVRFQINMLSLTGYYSGAARKLAHQLIAAGQVDFVGSDCHNALHIADIVKGIDSFDRKTLNKLHVLNDTLL